MTDYNKRLDEIINYAYEGEVGWSYDQLNGTSVMDEAIERIEGEKAKTKQAITSLIKELVADAKPEKQNTENMGDTFKVDWARGYNLAADQFEQNLLKELEEK